MKTLIKKLEALKIRMPDDDWGLGYMTINRRKYLVERDSKEYRMIVDLAAETNKKIDRLLKSLLFPSPQERGGRGMIAQLEQ